MMEGFFFIDVIRRVRRPKNLGSPFGTLYSMWFGITGESRMNPPANLKGTHKLITLRVPGRVPARILCLAQKDAAGAEAYYVLAECEGPALKWRSMIKDNAVRRLRDEFLNSIAAEQEVDALDVETIFLCAAEASPKA